MWYTSGTLVFVLSIIRILALRLRETPKFLLGKGRDEEVIDILNAIATKYDRSCSLTLEALQACDLAGPQIIVHEQGSQVCKMNTMRRGLFFSRIGENVKGLYVSRRVGLSTSLIWLSWLLIGLAYPLYNVSNTNRTDFLETDN